MKTVLITGGSRGIGKASVMVFLNNGYKVVTTSTSGKVPYGNNNITTYKLDLSNPISIKNLAKQLQDNGISLDILINNAAIASKGEAGVDIEVLRKTLNTNLIGTVDLTQRLTPLLNRDGVIVNISSEYGSLNNDWGFVAPSYRISKAALNMFTRNYYDYKEIKAKNIKVYSFDPGWVKTDMGGPYAEREPDEPAREIFELVNSGKDSGLFYKGLEVREW